MGEPTDLKLDVVQEDARGVIYSLRLPTNQELMVFFCKAGYLRGGHSHNVPEVVLLLSGKMEYHKMRDGREVISELPPGQAVWNMPDEVHMAEFLEDSWVAEWKIDSRVGESTTTDYEPFREQVRSRML